MSAAAIVGVGETRMGRMPDRSALALHAEATRNALDDAGLDKGEIDGVLTVGSMVKAGPHHSGDVCEYLGIEPAYADTIPSGGAGNCSMVRYAAMLVCSGVCRTVLCVAADNQLSGLTRDRAVDVFARNRDPEYEYPLGLSVPSAYALVAQRHFHEYGTTREDLARVAVACRRHAMLNPNAQLREPLTLAQALESKPVADPLHLTDCCLSSDGGGAVIVTSAARARDLAKPPISILGAGYGFIHEHICRAGNLTTTSVRRSGETAFRAAGVTPAEIDVALLYDCFTIAVLLQLEDYGFCEKGAAGVFLRDKGIELDGALPVNTNGGMLAFGNPGYPGGIFHIIEGVRQLRGECGPRQVRGARLALVGGLGGIMSHASTLILGG